MEDPKASQNQPLLNTRAHRNKLAEGLNDDFLAEVGGELERPTTVGGKFRDPWELIDTLYREVLRLRALPHKFAPVDEEVAILRTQLIKERHETRRWRSIRGEAEAARLRRVLLDLDAALRTDYPWLDTYDRMVRELYREEGRDHDVATEEAIERTQDAESSGPVYAVRGIAHAAPEYRLEETGEGVLL